MRKLGFLFVLIFAIFFFTSVNEVNAACDPPECGVQSQDCSTWGPPEYQCLAKCCVIPAGGGGGGSPTPPPGPGYEYHSCPAGTARRDLWRKSQICATPGGNSPC